MQQLDALCTREVEDVTVLIKEEKCHCPYKREKNVTVAVACLLSVVRTARARVELVDSELIRWW